jgi:hypothetical protein
LDISLDHATKPVQPKLGRIAEVPTEPQRGVGCDATPTLDDVCKTAMGNAQRLGEGVLREALISEKIFLDHLAGMP